MKKLQFFFMNTKAFLVLILSIGWIGFCQHWHCCWITQSCMVAPVVADTTPVAPVKKRPLVFNWSNSNPVTNDNIDAYLSNILTGMTDDNILEITGTYEADEPNPEGYENMGMARAEAIRDLLSDRISGERIRLKSKLVRDRKRNKDDGFVSHNFKWILPEVNESEVLELADKTVILFPFNSAKNKTDKVMEDYLSELAKRVRSSGEVVHLTGHTDNIGKARYNEKLGMKRSRKIRRILINKGVRRAQIKIYSKGMTEPVATNDSEEGRTQNRRVVVRVK